MGGGLVSPLLSSVGTVEKVRPVTRCDRKEGGILPESTAIARRPTEAAEEVEIDATIAAFRASVRVLLANIMSDPGLLNFRCVQLKCFLFQRLLLLFTIAAEGG